ncbi:hypothetical protein WAX88_09065 [Photobacterium damselae subsp. damselae]|uniref:hypothetical protein n=1 Tax=Photobacterium damselae TaxID=38293 RepID=UPI00311B3C07
MTTLLTTLISVKYWGIEIAIINGGQFLFSFFILIISISGYYKYKYHYISMFVKYYKYLFWFVTFFLLYQIIMRTAYMPLSFSEHQNFRKIGYFYQYSSLFIEPRGMAQFYLISFYVYFFMSRDRLKFIVSIIGVLLTASLGGILTLFVTLIFYSISKFYKFTSNKLNLKVLLLVLIGIPSLVFFINTSTGDLVLQRLDFIKKNLTGVSISNVLDNAYKLNHVDYYGQNSSEFEKIYGFKGGSSTVSVLSEASYLVHIIKTKPLFGEGSANRSRLLSLNAFVDFVTRLGLILSFIWIYLFYKEFRVTIKKDGLIFIMFIILFSSVDGALPKPQFWFLLAVLIIFNYKRLINDEIK